MNESCKLPCEIKYPFLTQRFGLSGWDVFTPIILTTDRNFQRRTHLDLKQQRRHLRVLGRNGQLLNEYSYDQAVKEEWYFYWNLAKYNERGEFTARLKSALVADLSKEKLRGYIFRDPDLHFSSGCVVRLERG